MNRRLLIVLMAVLAAFFLAQFGLPHLIAGLAILAFCTIGAITEKEKTHADMRD